MKNIVYAILVMGIVACIPFVLAKDHYHFSYSSNGMWHPSIRNQKRVAQFIRDNGCKKASYSPPKLRLNGEDLKVVRQEGRTFYSCPLDVDGKDHDYLIVDDSEVQP